MNAALDYYALEILGAALRDAHMRELDEPLNEDLLALCRRLGTEDEAGGAPKPAAHMRDS